MHRYAFHMLYLEDNTRAVIGVVSQPCTTSHLEMGYLLRPGSKTIQAIDHCDLQLYQWGENGVLPKFLRFTFKANGETYQVEIEVEREAEHFKGRDREARLVERFLKCRVNGVRGRGIAEWHYHNNIKK